MIGQTISHYRVTTLLGAGGMGEVYRATDTKLGREVALKILPQAFAQDTQRMTRFQREAQVLASLNHPNIATIYGLEETAFPQTAQPGVAALQTRALVMELVEGPTLAERIQQGALPLDEALHFAKQIAEALEYAHEKGIIHRDLKPANVKITTDGKAKVLDFGLAKALSDDSSLQDASHSPTLSMAATKAGVILGTAAYMSPEQARGKPADRRADIWSFGVVLYEMLSGRQIFGGETASDSMAAVITREPDWAALPAGVPLRVRELLRRCLVKDPRKRMQAIGDARIELEEANAAEAAPAAVPVSSDSSSWRARIVIAALVVVALAVGAGLQSLRTPRPVPQPVARVAQPIPGELVLPTRNRMILAISPDGSKMVLAANQRLYLRSLDSLTAAELPGTEGGASPFFSPDGQWVGFFAGGQTKKIRIAGGTPAVICTRDGFDASWAPNDTILIGTAFAGILSVSAQGGTPSVLVKPEPGILYLKPVSLPDGKSFLYVRGKPGSFESFEGVMRSFDKEDSAIVVSGTNQLVYAPTGHLLYATLPELFTVPFDVASRRVTGNAVRVAQDVDFTNAGGTTQFSLSTTGTLVYLSGRGGRGMRTRLAAVDRAGKASPLPLDMRDYSDPKISPDGRQVAAHLQDAQNDVWVADVARGTMSRLSFDPAEDETPIWSPDGRTVAWSATRGTVARGVYSRAADGSGKENLLWSLENHAHLRDWLPDGKALVVEIQDPKTGMDIWRLDLGEKPAPTVFLQTPFNERASRLSPDGHWLVYSSDESGRDEVYIQSFPSAGAKVQVSTGGGEQPVWARNGKAVFFRGEGAIQEATFETSPRLAVGKPHALFPDFYESPQMSAHTSFDVFPDGRFLMIQAADSRQNAGPSRNELIFVFNWFEELRRMAVSEKK